MLKLKKRANSLVTFAKKLKKKYDAGVARYENSEHYKKAIERARYEGGINKKHTPK